MKKKTFVNAELNFVNTDQIRSRFSCGAPDFIRGTTYEANTANVSRHVLSYAKL